MRKVDVDELVERLRAEAAREAPSVEESWLDLERRWVDGQHDDGSDYPQGA
jgi:hypothetical protein